MKRIIRRKVGHKYNNKKNARRWKTKCGGIVEN
jgi:hypothetical protein